MHIKVLRNVVPENYCNLSYIIAKQSLNELSFVDIRTVNTIFFWLVGL